MASRHLVALGSLVFVLIALATVSSCGPSCSDGGEGCSCTTPFECVFPSGCYRAYCDGTCHFEPFPAGSACAMYSCSFDGPPCVMGICTADFACVQCTEDSHCGAGHTCEPDNVCTRCDDGVKNGDEADVDCGGPCPLCPGTCNVNADCPDGYCWEGSCVSCHDGIQNGDETGIDCGIYQGHCPICFGNLCWSNDDCASKACEYKYCCATPCPLCYECGPPNGECMPIAFGEYDIFYALDPPNICYANFYCDGKGKCGRAIYEHCTQNDECASAMCVNGKCS